MQIREILDRGLAAHRAGDLNAAIRHYQAVLQQNQGHADAWHLLGLAQLQMGHGDPALRALRRSVELSSANPAFHNSLGEALRAAGRAPESAAAFQEAIRLRPSLAEAHYNMGIHHGSDGAPSEAAACFERALHLNPKFAAAHNGLGVVRQQQGRSAEAADCFQRATQIEPRAPGFWLNLANAQLERKQFSAARSAFDRALALDRRSAACHFGLGLIAAAEGDADAAAACYRRALSLEPEHIGALNNLGNALLGAGHAGEALTLLRRVTQLRPDWPEALSNFGRAAMQTGDMPAALSAFQRAASRAGQDAAVTGNIARLLSQAGLAAEALPYFERAVGALASSPASKEDAAELYCDLALVLSDMHRFQDACATAQTASDLRPGWIKPLIAFSIAAAALGRFTDALAAIGKARALAPDDIKAQFQHGVLLHEIGDVAAARSALSTALDSDPRDRALQDAYLMHLLYDPSVSAAFYLAEARRTSRDAYPPISPQPHSSDQAPDRRLRIGYVSADFRQHSCAHFLSALLPRHDRANYEIACYANVRAPDSMTEELRQSTDLWRDIHALTDEAVDAQIRRDRVDILIDLSGHTKGNRLGVFARRPAPVQAAWLGFAGPTGIEAIDYRLGDAIADPPSGDGDGAGERIWRLDRCFLAFRPPPDAPDVGAPAPSPDQVSFGSFNALAKITPEVVAVWADILRAVPGSRLALKHIGGADSVVVARFQDLFATHGIAAARVHFIDWRRDVAAHLSSYAQIDVALDPFPYNGTTTTLEALWMGVPVVSLAGARHAGRVGASLLTHAGVPELLADRVEDYVAKAVALAGDAPLRALYRRDLRAMLRGSTLLDGSGFARAMEAAYRAMWREWCGR